jgi:hypothetical protein
MINNINSALLIYQMLDELAVKEGYKNGANDLIGEEPAVNTELLQIVFENLIAQIKHREDEAKRILKEAEKEAGVAYV